MKNILLATAVIFVLASCSKDEKEIIPVNGQYIANAGDLTAAVILKDGNCTYFALFMRGEVVSSWTDITTSGSYPNYTYRVSELNIIAKFENATTFSVILDGVLSTGANFGGLQNGMQVAFEGSIPIKFELDNRVLDANGDGILDERQPDIQISKFSANKFNYLINN